MNNLMHDLLSNKETPILELTNRYDVYLDKLC